MMDDFEDFLTPQSPVYLTVFEATQQIKFLLETELSSMQIEGEISNFLHHSSGHMYFSIKDAKAQMPCVMWAGRNSTLAFKPADGMKVRLEGRITVYERRGAYQLDVISMQPVGIGPLQQAFERLKAKLDAEGLFDDSCKKTIPDYAGRIGIVTSETGAAVRDIISVIRRRWPAAQLILRPALVQGETAAADIACAIEEFNAFGEIDVLIVGRGGGSLEDLWAFNEEIVARAIAVSQIPIISAVGHQIDFTIADFVADLRAPTPSVAAELAVPDQTEFNEQIRTLLCRAFQQVESKVYYARQQFAALLRSYGLRMPLDGLIQARQTLDELQSRMQASMDNKIEFEKQRLNSLTKQLDSLSHRSILRRGFSIVRDKSSQAIVREAAVLHVDQIVDIEHAQGCSEAKINAVFDK